MDIVSSEDVYLAWGLVQESGKILKNREENKIFQCGFNLVKILRIVNNIRNNSITLEVEYETLELKDPSEIVLFSSWALDGKKKNDPDIFSAIVQRNDSFKA